MNRNTKHPDRPHKRRNRNGDRTRNDRAWRVTASWNTAPDKPVIRHTADRAEARRLARELTHRGMYVVLEQHRGHGDWRTLAEYDGPALAHQRRTERRTTGGTR